jgi:hypothetical protein
MTHAPGDFRLSTIKFGYTGPAVSCKGCGRADSAKGPSGLEFHLHKSSVPFEIKLQLAQYLLPGFSAWNVTYAVKTRLSASGSFSGQGMESM